MDEQQKQLEGMMRSMIEEYLGQLAQKPAEQGYGPSQGFGPQQNWGAAQGYGWGAHSQQGYAGHHGGMGGGPWGPHHAGPMGGFGPLGGLGARLGGANMQQFLMGALLGGAAAYVLSDAELREKILKGAMKLYGGVMGGFEEMKEQMADIKAEMEAKQGGMG